MSTKGWIVISTGGAVLFPLLCLGCNPTLASIPGERGSDDDGGAADTGSALPDDGGASAGTGDTVTPDGGENHCLEPDESDSATGTATDSLDTPVNSDSGGIPSHGVETDTEEGNRGTDTRVETSEETDTDTTMTPDSDTESEFHPGTGSETTTGSEADSVTQMDSDTPTSTGNLPEPTCDDDMVLVSANPARGIATSFCMDRYEASRPDATDGSAGADGTVATSRPGVIPWFVNPMSADALTLFQNACLAAGKRLCSSEEWGYSCAGPNDNNYSFGVEFDAEICNSVDTYCDDYCVAEGIPAEECDTEENCGYHCGGPGSDVSCFHVDPTGSFAGCTNAFGAFDVNGNVWEVVPSEGDSRGYEVRGGAFNCAYPGTRFDCAYNAGWTALYAGFRCCKAPSGRSRWW